MNYYKKIIEYRQKITAIAFSFLAVLVGALVATGFKFSWTVFTDWSFYVKTGINYAIMITIFNTIKSDIIRTEKARDSNSLAQAKARTNRYTKIVRDEHLEDLIDEEAAKETERRRLAACNRELQHFTYGLTLVDGLINYGTKTVDDKEVSLTEDEFFEQRHLTKRQIKKVKKSINRVLNSQINYISVSANEILTGYQQTFQGCDDPLMSLDERHENIKESNKKTLIFLLTAAVTNVVVWNSVDMTSFWAMVLAHATLILSSVMSAISVAYNRINLLTQIEVNRASFLNQVIPADILNKFNQKSVEVKSQGVLNNEEK